MYRRSTIALVLGVLQLGGGQIAWGARSALTSMVKSPRNRNKFPVHNHRDDVDNTIEALRSDPNANTKARADYALKLYQARRDSAVRAGEDRADIEKWRTEEQATAVLAAHSAILVSRVEDLTARIEVSREGLEQAMKTLAGAEQVTPDATVELIKIANHGLMRLSEIDTIIAGLSGDDRTGLGQTLADLESFAQTSRQTLSAAGADYNERLLTAQEQKLSDYRERIAETRLAPNDEISTMRELSATLALADGLTLDGKALAEVPTQSDEFTSTKANALRQVQASAVALADALVTRVDRLTPEDAYSDTGPDGRSRHGLKGFARYLLDEMQAFAQVVADAPHILEPEMVNDLKAHLERLKRVEWPLVTYDPAHDYH